LPHSVAGIAAVEGRCNELLVARIRVRVAEDIANNLVVDFKTSEFEQDQSDNFVEGH
jgi:hypothetical protein